MTIASLVFISLIAVSSTTAEISDGGPNRADPISQTEIIVEEPTEGRERRNELRRFASEVLNKPTLRQTVSTYSVPVCPRVFGLPEEDALKIEARMRANAVELGANRSNPSPACAHNTSVIFVPSDQGTADTWLDHGSKPLRHLRTYERTRVLSEEGPVRAWTYRERRAQGPVYTGYLQGQPGPFTFASGGFSHAQGRSYANPLVGSVVIIELDQAKEKSLTQLADYASMRTFANTKGIEPDAVPAAQTILTLFQDGDAAPQELTAFDRSLIEGLYATFERASKSQFYGNIAKRAFRQETIQKASLDLP